MYKCSVYDIYQEPTPNCFITNNEKTKTKTKTKLISGQMLHNLKSNKTSAGFQNLATEPHCVRQMNRGIIRYITPPREVGGTDTSELYDFNSTRPTFIYGCPSRSQCSETSTPSFLYHKAIKGRGNETGNEQEVLEWGTTQDKGWPYDHPSQLIMHECGLMMQRDPCGSMAIQFCFTVPTDPPWALDHTS